LRCRLDFRVSDIFARAEHPANFAISIGGESGNFEGKEGGNALDGVEAAGVRILPAAAGGRPEFERGRRKPEDRGMRR
jgi:hypothetical protein